MNYDRSVATDDFDASQAGTAEPVRKPKGFLGKFWGTIKGLRRSLAWKKKFNPLAPKKGEMAPDFTLSDVQGENPITLSEHFGREPVALVFGSFT